MKKQITALLTAAALSLSGVLGVFAAPANNVEGNETAVLTDAVAQSDVSVSVMPNSESVKRGDTITYTVKANSVKLIDTLTLKFSYDTDSLEFVSYEKGRLMNYSYINQGLSQIALRDVKSEDITGKQMFAFLYFNEAHTVTDDDVFTVTFKVKDGARLGTRTDLFAAATGYILLQHQVHRRSIPAHYARLL